MPRGFGLAATRRANFKMPTVQLAAAHFATTPVTIAAGTLLATDLIGDAGGFSVWTVATSPGGLFAASVNLTETTTCYLKGSSPYPLVKSAVVTVS